MNYTEVLSQTYYDNTGWSYMIALGIFVSCFVLLKIIEVVVLHRLKKLAKKTTNDLDDMIIEFLEELNWPFVFGVSLFVSLKYLTLHGMVDEILGKMFLIFVTFYGVKAINKVISYMTMKQVNKRDDDDDSLAIILGMIVKGFIWVIAALLVMSNMGINITSLIAGLGVGGIAIAFALQKILEDIFSSFSIYFDKPFEVGDYIVIGEDSGTVQHIGLKTTRIRHLKGNELVVSNRELTSIRINNYKKMKKRRIAFTFGVEYGTPVKKLKKINVIVAELFKRTENADLDRVHFKEFGDSSLNYEVVYFVNSSDYIVYMDIQEKVNLGLVEAFEKEKIEFAFPTQTIHLKK